MMAPAGRLRAGSDVDIFADQTCASSSDTRPFALLWNDAGVAPAMTPPTACDQTNDQRPLWQRMTTAPQMIDPERPCPAYLDFEQCVAAASPSSGQEGLSELLGHGLVRRLIAAIAEGSPYLMNLIRRDPDRLEGLLRSCPDRRLDLLRDRLADDLRAAGDVAQAMSVLRCCKNEAALLIALCDLGGVWPVMKVTDALSQTADFCLRGSIDFLLRQEADKGRFLPLDPECPSAGSGYIVIGMGKYGAFELNYSSDIDLIVFFDRHIASKRLSDPSEIQKFFVRLTRDLVRLMDERTHDGYVFRMDLRLRPDAGATQIALSTDAGLAYYESFGQNWERAAMIKARAVAGDIPAGEMFLENLRPFIWRKYLDFAAIADVHAMKRQIHAFRGFGQIGVLGHNIKVGRGGIREIEFFVQTQQLIAGGRQPDLRDRRTLETLAQLASIGWIEESVRDELADAYRFLRAIEHRIQMVADEQTQTLPSDPDRLASLARFSGYPTADAFSDALRDILQRVQGHYAALFEDAPELTARQQNLVFSGQDDDPETVAILERMGYAQPHRVIETVRGWHAGRYAAVRSPRSRERLTDLQPILIEALSQTADPDGALASFDRFLKALPAGIQLFALLGANPNLLRLMADIMGTAPRLAHILSRRRRLLDAVIDPQTFEKLPSTDDLKQLIDFEIARGQDFQEELDRARIVGSEQSFLIGIRVLSGAISAAEAGGAFAQLAQEIISKLLGCVEDELAQTAGRVPGGQAAIVAMGKLGSAEMTASSDLDLILIYDHEAGAMGSDGPKSLAPSQYYARLTQRLIMALSAPTAEGSLYEVDMRLRPSGQQGPVATRFSSFERYQAEEAWTWEHLALTRARVVSGPPDFCAKVNGAIQCALRLPRDRATIASDVRDMRERIFKEKGSEDVWDLKNVRGGLIDIEFATQFLQLVHAHDHPEVLKTNTIEALQGLAERGFLSAGDADVLLTAARLFQNVTQVLRICAQDFKPGAAPPGLKALAARAGGQPDFATLELTMTEMAERVADVFNGVVR